MCNKKTLEFVIILDNYVLFFLEANKYVIIIRFGYADKKYK